MGAEYLTIILSVCQFSRSSILCIFVLFIFGTSGGGLCHTATKVFCTWHFRSYATIDDCPGKKLQYRNSYMCNFHTSHRIVCMQCDCVWLWILMDGKEKAAEKFMFFMRYIFRIFVE